MQPEPRDTFQSPVPQLLPVHFPGTEPGIFGGTGHHVGYDASAGVVDSVEVTDGRGGEHLGRFGLGKGDLGIGDRGYAHEKRIAEALETGGDILVRVGHSAVPPP